MKKELSLRARKRSVLEFIEREREFDWIYPSRLCRTRENYIEREREIKNNRSLVSLIYSSNDEKEKKKEEYAKRIYPGLHSESSTRDSTSRISKAFSFQESQGFLFRRKREKSQRTS